MHRKILDISKKSINELCSRWRLAAEDGDEITYTRGLLFFLLVILLLMLSACVPGDAVEPSSTPRVISLEEDLAAEEAAAEAIATARAEKTQIASKISPYAEITSQEHAYLAFWFTWNDETVFLPIAEYKSDELTLPICQMEPETEIAIGKLLSGISISEHECMVDEKKYRKCAANHQNPKVF